jgi:transcriptional regulator with XRE-family HTH domain
MLDLSREEVASQAGIAERTLIDFERGARKPMANNLAAIQRALEVAGVEFIPENGGGPGVRLRKIVTG